MSNYNEIIKNGLWFNNTGLVQLLGLCPLLAVTGSVVNGLALGLATLVTLLLSNSIISAIRHHVPDDIRIPVFVTIIACIVTTIELLMHAYLHQLYLVLGIFVPLIVTNCSIIGRAEAFAAKNPVFDSALDGIFMGLGFTLVLVALGAIREFLGNQTLFSHMNLLFGDSASSWVIQFSGQPGGFLLAVLPPGAFFGLGALIAIKNIIDKKMAERKPAIEAIPVTTE